ncbi:YcaO-like family protein [Streptomyces chartreusis]|uniref:YcaO-like family protein n=1 Tax=Streptomyces chartreusis TaxID=1969 RepID=UPI0037B7A0B5
MNKTYFKGTHRVRGPAETLDIITPFLPRFGITRLADVTGLDTLGIPVVMSVRPASATLSVSQGKGFDLVSAQVSAAMEATELWHAENAVPPAVAQGVCATDLSLPYTVAEIDGAPESLATDSTPLDWIEAAALCTGKATHVPRGLIEMRWQPAAWPPPLVVSTSNGLSSGNTRAESAVHGLYEAIERDATSTLAAIPVEQRTYLRPETVTDPAARELIDRLIGNKAWLEIISAPSRLGVPCFVCYLWSPDFGIAISSGSGAHSDPSVALCRAITEAAQSRLTCIVGSRDDINPQVFRAGQPELRSPETVGQWVDWQQLSSSPQTFAACEDEQAWLADQIFQLTGREPLLVDLSTEPAFAVTKVLCPGLAYLTRHEIPRPTLGAAA